MPFADRISRIQSSLTLELSAKAKALAKAGEPVINLSVGEPDFPTPEHVCQAGIDAIREGYTKYTASSGIPELRAAVAENFNQIWGADYGPQNIVIGCGAKHTIANTVLATCQRGDEVLIPSPYWLSYPEMAHLAHADPVIIPLGPEDDFKLTPELLKKHLSPRSRLIIFNTPSNPTGVAYGLEEMAALIPVIKESGIWLASDEIYSKIIYDGRTHHSFAAFPELRERLVVVDGWSKSYAMTGWRIGLLAAPTSLATAVGKMQSHTTSNASSISQYAALAALRGPQDELNTMVAEFEQRRDIALELVTSLANVHCRKPEGAFYLFPDVSWYLGKSWQGEKIETTLELCRHVLDKFKLAIVPGNVFGAEGFVRISYAASREEVREGIVRLGEALATLE